MFRLQRAGGISSYWAGLLRGFLQAGGSLPWKSIEYPPFENPERNSFSIPPTNLHLKPFRPLERIRRVRLPDADPIVHHSSYYRVCSSPRALNVVTVYDFIHERFRRDPASFAFRFQKWRALSQADAIIAISKSTLDDMLGRYPALQRRRLRVIYPGFDSVFSRNPDPHASAEPEPMALRGRPFALFVGSRAPYKNFEMAVRLTAREKDLGLAVVGGGALSLQHERLLSELLAGRAWHFATMNNAELARQYRRALCLLYPSAYEGFGIPVVEAMASGCPVVALSTSSIAEIADGHFPLAQSESEAHELLGQLVRGGATRRAAIEAGLKRSKDFTTDACNRQTLALLQELARTGAQT